LFQPHMITLMQQMKSDPLFFDGGMQLDRNINSAEMNSSFPDRFSQHGVPLRVHFDVVKQDYLTSGFSLINKKYARNTHCQALRLSGTDRNRGLPSTGKRSSRLNHSLTHPIV
jgi:hypothetical protein